jgi:hypothetical protein
MSASENGWSIGLLAGLLLAFYLFRRMRRPTKGFAEARAFKARLPGWVKQFEALLFCGLACATIIGVIATFFRLARLLHWGDVSVGPAAIYSSIGAVLIAVPVSALAANLVSWLLPPVRAANYRAMGGSRVSFRSQNWELLLFGLVSIPLGLVLLTVAAIAPWR